MTQIGGNSMGFIRMRKYWIDYMWYGEEDITNKFSPQISTDLIDVVSLFSVVDINDSGLIFERSVYSARVSELAPRGHFIVKVSAYDPDSVDSLRYAIVGHNHYQSAFEIDDKSG